MQSDVTCNFKTFDAPTAWIVHNKVFSYIFDLMLLYSKSSSSDSRCRFAKELVKRLTVLDDILCFFQTTYNLDLATS